MHWTLELDAREQIKTKTWQRSIWERARGLSQTDQTSGSGSAAVTVRLGFHSHSSPAAFTPSTPPCTNFSLHWVPFICMWSCTSTVSNQTNLAPCLPHPFQLPSMLLLPLLPSFQRSHPHSLSPLLQSLPRSHSRMICLQPSLTHFCHSQWLLCVQPQRPAP